MKREVFKKAERVVDPATSPLRSIFDQSIDSPLVDELPKEPSKEKGANSELELEKSVDSAKILKEKLDESLVELQKAQEVVNKARMQLLLYMEQSLVIENTLQPSLEEINKIKGLVERSERLVEGTQRVLLIKKQIYESNKETWTITTNHGLLEVQLEVQGQSYTGLLESRYRGISTESTKSQQNTGSTEPSQVSSGWPEGFSIGIYGIIH